MFALIGLLGIALAGSAFVGVTAGEEEETDLSDGIADEEPEETADIFEGLDLEGDEEPDEQTMEGTDGADVLAGSDVDTVDDTIIGLGGDDYMNGFDGNDTMLGGDGDDQIHGGGGHDTMTGDDGDDLVYGYIGNDELTGGAGNDTLHGGDGSDIIEGGYDDDELLGGYGHDTLIGGAGRDMIQGSEGDDVIDGVTGEDEAERDYLNGSEGNDRLIGNDSDVMSGGTGTDTFEITDGTVSIMDYTDDDTLVLNYDGDLPVLTTEVSESGLMLFADGTPVASLYGVTTFDVGNVQLVAS